MKVLSGLMGSILGGVASVWADERQIDEFIAFFHRLKEVRRSVLLAAMELKQKKGEEKKGEENELQ